MLQLDGLQRAAPDELQPAIEELQDAARAGVEDVREIARGLRPQALDEFGLRSALISLCAQVSDRAGMRVRPRLSSQLPALAPELDLAIYRVAQESLTNVARHAGADNVTLELDASAATVTLRVRDDGRGITDREAADRSVGLGGMHERALLAGGTLTIRRCEPGGTEVRLEVPARAAT